VGFRREEGEGSAAQRWIDHNLPTCPLCKSQSLWEISSEGDKQGIVRWAFRCPNCEAVLSTIPPTATSALAEPVQVPKVPLEVNVRVDSVVRSQDEDFVGEEFPLSELQDWASEEEG
jgi:hypothetical protein